MISNDDKDVKCIHETFHEQALLTPNRTCLIDATSPTNKTYTYAETQRRVLLLASEIQATLKDSQDDKDKKKDSTNETSKDKVVAIYLEQSPEYIIAVLAILSAGCAYVPLELAYPTTMLQRVLRDCHPIAIITDVQYKAQLPDVSTLSKEKASTLIVMDDNKHHQRENNEEELLTLWRQYELWDVRVTLDELAFIVYSSGTTGQPKGIANSHRAPALSYKWRFNSVRDCPPDSIVACNVFFVWECLRPLLRGAAVIPIPPSVIFDGALLSALLQRHGVTEMLFTPSLLENLLNTVDWNEIQARLCTIQTIYLNGEVVTMELRRRCLKLFPQEQKCKFFNLYSISECHEVSAISLDDIDTTQDKMKFCPVGLPSTQIYIMPEGMDPSNGSNNPCTINQALAMGEAGELYVAGPMLARGYLNLPTETSQRFITLNGVRMYRTGDRARLLPSSGQLEILGRCDFMVKIRGYSIVLGAVEAALLEAIHLTSCVVVADDDDGEGNKHLVAYVVRSTSPTSNVMLEVEEGESKLSEWTIDPRTGACPEIRRAVVSSLPHYMIPSVFIELESLPVKEVGAKLDRKALKTQSADRRTMLRSLQLSSATHTTHLQSPTEDSTTTSTNQSYLNTNEDDHGHDAGLDSKATALKWKRMVRYLSIPPEAPFEDIEDGVTSLFEIALERPIGSLKPTSDFLEEGGHSLSAARLIALLNKVFFSQGKTTTSNTNSLNVMQLFRNSATVHSISLLICDSSKECEDSSSKEWSMVGTDDSATSNDDSNNNNNNSSALIIKQVRDDALLPIDLQFPPEEKNTAIAATPVTLDKAKNILLTGVTGFFGSHILKQIFTQNSSATVYCLMRNASTTTTSLLTQLKEQFGMDISDDTAPSRIVLIRGDLSLPQLGLTNDIWSQLVSQIDLIVHCGAAVSLTAPYAKLHSVNVGGTLNIIRLAHACRCPGTSLIYVSSNGIFPNNDAEVFLENDDIACLPDRLGSADGYGLSKWAADCLVSAAHKTLGLPTMTIRFGNLGWQSKTGVGNPLDYQGMMLSGCRRLGVFPKVTKGWLLEVTPVDFASSSLVTLASDSNVLDSGSIFHCVQDGYTLSENVYRWMCDTDGRSYRSASFNEWKKTIETSVAENSDANDSDMIGLMALVSGIDDNDSYLSSHSHLDCSKLDSSLARTGASLSRRELINEAYYTTFFEATFEKVFDRKLTVSVPSFDKDNSTTVKAIKADPSTKSDTPAGPLAGKVAVVTGASSGIGRAIVVALVQAGCHVAMGARRMGELEKTRSIVAESCQGCASKTICVSTDVTKREQVESLVDTTESVLGPVDILVNVAGCMYFTLMKNVIWDQWEQQVDVNAKGTMYGIGTVLPKMLDRGKGHIVNITSDAGRKAFAGLGIYSGSKFFVEAISQALRLETASTGLRVTCIQPGNTETPLLSKSTDPEGLEEYGTPTGAKVLEPSDIARAVVYALTQPEWCAVNEILVEPREEPA